MERPTSVSAPNLGGSLHAPGHDRVTVGHLRNQSGVGGPAIAEPDTAGSQQMAVPRNDGAATIIPSPSHLASRCALHTRRHSCMSEPVICFSTASRPRRRHARTVRYSAVSPFVLIVFCSADGAPPQVHGPASQPLALLRSTLHLPTRNNVQW